MKYIKEDTTITFSEIPDEISLCINISGCPCHCPDCHSKYLWEDVGEELTYDVVERLIRLNPGATCVCLMGGDADPKYINTLAQSIKNDYDIKVAWYSGRNRLSDDIDIKNFNYIKLGPYNKTCGPLNERTTNQIFFEVFNDKLINATYKFWI